MYLLVVLGEDVVGENIDYIVLIDACNQSGIDSSRGNDLQLS